MIVNKTKNTVVAEKFLRKTGFGKVVGLVGKNKEEAIVFKTRFGIHTFFLKFPIDLVVLNSKNSVVFIKKGIKPNRIVFWNILYDTVIELPSKSLIKSKTQKGDILKLSL